VPCEVRHYLGGSQMGAFGLPFLASLGCMSANCNQNAVMYESGYKIGDMSGFSVASLLSSFYLYVACPIHSLIS